MALYSLTRLTTATTINTPSYELIAGASDRSRLLELHFCNTASTAFTIGIGRPQAVGVNPTSPVTVLAENPSDPTGKSTTALAWTTTAPTVPLVYIRRYSSQNVVGFQYMFQFPLGLVIPASGSIVSWNITTTVAYYMTCVVDE